LRLNFTESYSAAITKAAATLRKKKKVEKEKKNKKDWSIIYLIKHHQNFYSEWNRNYELLFNMQIE
jgi:hypothetical protein